MTKKGGSISRKRLNIAVLIKNFNTVGGAEKYAVEVTRRLSERGHNVSIYSWSAEKQAAAGLTFHRVPNRLTFSSVLNLYSFSREVSRMLSDKVYDVILSHDRTASQDMAVIHTFSYKSGIEKYSFLRKIDQLYLSPRSGLHLWLEKQQMKTPWLAAVSGAVRADIQAFYGRRDPIDVINPGIDIDAFSPSLAAGSRDRVRKEEGIPEDDMVVLFVGSEFKRKGLDRLIPAIKGPMRLMIAGRGENLAYYKKLAKTHGVDTRVAFLGLTPDIGRYYAAADVVVLPSRIEAFGMSILEGMACGHPVVTSAEAGCAALIDDGVNGFICRNAGDLARILDRLKQPDLRKRIGARARALAEEHSWESTADQFENRCFQIAEAKKSSRLQAA
jgi:UDP-glucose:(heptosyl)LPS alpha-1,3-glucosyltransferase